MDTARGMNQWQIFSVETVTAVKMYFFATSAPLSERLMERLQHDKGVAVNEQGALDKCCKGCGWYVPVSVCKSVCVCVHACMHVCGVL